MAAPESYRADIPAEVNNFYERVLLERAVPLTIHALLGQRRNIPANAGSRIIKFRRYGVLAAATTALTEGAAPTGKSLSVTDITATALQYGDWTKISDVVATESIDPVLTEAAEIFGDQMGDTNDQLARAVLVAGTTIQYASTATSRVTVGSAMKMAVAEVREAVRTLKENKARKITTLAGGTPNAGTVPINAAFLSICHPRTTYDLKGDSAYVPVEKYAASVGALLPGEVGSMDEVRFLETTNAVVFTAAGAGGIDVYGTLIFGANAYGVVDLAGSQNASLIYKGLGSAGTADPLSQVQTLGWKEYFVTKILNESFMLRIEHAVT